MSSGSIYQHLRHQQFNLQTREAINMTPDEYTEMHKAMDDIAASFDTIITTDPNKARAILSQYLDLISSNYKKLKTQLK